MFENIIVDISSMIFSYPHHSASLGLNELRYIFLNENFDDFPR